MSEGGHLRRFEGVIQSQPSPDSLTKLRDHLANERTFSAWLRTALAILALNLLVERFSLFGRLAGAGHQGAGSVGVSTAAGTALMVLGLLVIPLSLWRFLRQRRDIGGPVSRMAAWPTVLLVSALVMVAIVLVASVLLDPL